MSLIPIRTTNITIPEIVIENKKIGKNHCKRIYIPKKKVNVDIYDSDHDGWYEFRTKDNLPFSTFYLKKYKSKQATIDNAFCLLLKGEYNIADIDETSDFKWLQTNIQSQSQSPKDIVDSWHNKFSFKEADEISNEPGLRKPQLGALHAIAAYFSLKKNTEAATIVLPTGTGKTETMLATLIYKQFNKVLIILPSKALREQTAKKFYSLGCLTDIEVLPKDILLPFVGVLEEGLSSVHNAELILNNSNVVITTVDSINASSKESVEFLCAHIDSLFVDEAHHISARTWNAIKEKFKGKNVLQFTATPFRNDKKNLDGQIIYHYTVSEAQNSGYFKHINFFAIEEYLPDNIDKKIAETAIKKLKSDLSADFNHIIMARVDTIEHAEVVLSIYKALASEFNPIIVHSKMNSRETNKLINDLKEGKSRIIVCVNMLGEGFDLPNLKIAALHDAHKSLAITLQFVGRFIRNSSGNTIGDASVIVNVADPKVSKELQNLYSQGAEWDEVISRLSEERIEREISLQDIINKLKDKGSLHKHISLWNLRPAFSSMLFYTNATDWNPELYKDILPRDTVSWHSYSDTENLIVVLAMQEAPVKWGNYKEIFDSIYQVLIMKFDKERKALFIYSNDYDFFRAEKLAETVCGGNYRLCSGRKIFNIITKGINYPLVKNLGTSQAGAISFTQYFGPNVTEGLHKIEKATSSLMNLAGVGYENGDRILVGCSQKKGKIWSLSGGKINDWINWVQKSWDKIQTGNIADDTDENDIIKDFLRPEKMESNHNQRAYSISWGEHIQESFEEKVLIKFATTEIPLYLVDINIIDNTQTNASYQIILSTEDIQSIYEFSIFATADQSSNNFKYSHISGPKIEIKKSTNYVPLEEYFEKDPPIIQYVDGSHSYNCFLIKTKESVGKYNLNDINTLDWNGVNISKESMGSEKDTDSIQWKTYDSRMKNNSFDIIINDDGTGEIADLIGIKSIDDKIHLTFIHCKYSSEPVIGARIKDFDVVCGQAQKSVRWKHVGMKHIYEHIKQRENKWAKNNKTRFLKGNIKDLEVITRKAYTYKLELNTIIVQPGLKKSSASDDILSLLECTALYLKKTANSDIEVICSD